MLNIYTHARTNKRTHKHRNDLNGLCRKYGLSFDSILESTAQEQSGRVSLQSFQSYMHRHYPYEDYHPASPPPRPSSGSKLQRQSVHTPSLPHHTRTPLKYVGSPQGHGGYERDVDDYKRASYRQEHSRTPEVGTWGLKLIMQNLIQGMWLWHSQCLCEALHDVYKVYVYSMYVHIQHVSGKLYIMFKCMIDTARYIYMYSQ